MRRKTLVEEIGKALMLFGAILLIVGVLLWLIGQVPGLGRLPGDIVIRRENFSCFFPLATCILLSIVLTMLLNILFRLFNK
jgi:hypothetical protein